MKKLLIVLSLLASFQVMAQQNKYKKIDDDGAVVFQGQCTLADVYREPSFGWMRKGIDEYEPNREATDVLKAQLNRYHLVVFMGTWCSDSHDLLPKLYRTLDRAQYPLADITLYGVDMKKTTGNGEEKTYNITLVPTIIVLDGAKEIGRITETVEKSIEDDLAAIVSKNDARHSRKKHAVKG